MPSFAGVSLTRTGPLHSPAPLGSDHSSTSGSPPRASWKAAYSVPLSRSTSSEGVGGVKTMNRSAGVSTSSTTDSFQVAPLSVERARTSCQSPSYAGPPRPRCPPP